MPRDHRTWCTSTAWAILAGDRCVTGGPPVRLMLAIVAAVAWVAAVLVGIFAIFLFQIDGNDVPPLCADNICETTGEAIRALVASIVLGTVGWVSVRVRSRRRPTRADADRST